MRKDQSYLRMIHETKKNHRARAWQVWREALTAVITDFYCLTNVSIISMITKIVIDIALKRYAYILRTKVRVSLIKKPIQTNA
jgi:hypothetical protein